MPTAMAFAASSTASRGAGCWWRPGAMCSPGPPSWIRRPCPRPCATCCAPCRPRAATSPAPARTGSGWPARCGHTCPPYGRRPAPTNGCASSAICARTGNWDCTAPPRVQRLAAGCAPRRPLPPLRRPRAAPVVRRRWPRRGQLARARRIASADPAGGPRIQHARLRVRLDPHRRRAAAQSAGQGAWPCRTKPVSASPRTPPPARSRNAMASVRDCMPWVIPCAACPGINAIGEQIASATATVTALAEQLRSAAETGFFRRPERAWAGRPSGPPDVLAQQAVEPERFVLRDARLQARGRQPVTRRTSRPRCDWSAKPAPPASPAQSIPPSRRCADMRAIASSTREYRCRSR